MTFAKKNTKVSVYNDVVINANEKAYLEYFKKNKEYHGWFR